MACACDTCTGKRCCHCGCKRETLPPGPHVNGSATTYITPEHPAYVTICCKCGEETGIFWPNPDPTLGAAAGHPVLGGGTTMGQARGNVWGWP